MKTINFFFFTHQTIVISKLSYYKILKVQSPVKLYMTYVSSRPMLVPVRLVPSHYLRARKYFLPGSNFSLRFSLNRNGYTDIHYN